MDDRKENMSYGLNEPYQNNTQYEQQPYGQNNAPYGQNSPYEQNNMPYGQNTQPYEQSNMPYGQNTPYGQQQYGQPPYNQQQYPYPARAVVRDTMSERNGAGIAGFVIACFALLCCWIPIFDLVFSIAGIICSAIGMGKNKQTGRGLAIAGLIISIISLVISLFMLFLLILGLSL